MFDELHNHMLKNGLPYSGHIQLDGQIRRYCKDGTQKKDEWYVGSFISDSHFWCTYGSWTSDQKHKFRTWKDEGEISPEQLQAYKNQIEHAEKAKKQQVLKTRQEVFIEYNSLPETTDHPYLKKKGIKCPTKIKDGWIWIPLCNTSGEFQTVQTINKNGEKRFYTGLPCAGCCYVFGTPQKDKESLLAEGFATAYSLHTATGKPVFCAFSGANLFPLASKLKEGGYLITNAQDLGEAGDRYAEELKKINVVSVKPRFATGQGKDFNDLFLTEGKDAVFKCFSIPICGMRLIDLLNSDIPPLEWYIENLVMKGSVNLIWAPPGVGKSTFCYALGMHATAAKQFLRRGIKEKLRVLYFDGEMTRIEIKSKTQFLINAMELTPEEAPDEDSFIVINFEMWEEMYGDPIDLYSPNTKLIIDELINHHKPHLIFFDNLTSLTGLGEEAGYSNKEESWKSLYAWLRSFIKKNLGVIVVHHANKAGEVAGTGAISRTVQTEIELRKHENNPEAQLVFEMHYNKARHIVGKERKPRLICFDPEEIDQYKIYPKERNNKKLYQYTSHWWSLDLPEKK